MAMDERVRVVKPSERFKADPTPGMQREQAISTKHSWSGHVTTEAGMISGWHHHGEHESHIYVLSGALRIEFGPDGGGVVEAGPGDFVYVPANTVHRESNPGSTDSEVIVVRIGSGATVVNVNGPDRE